MPIRNNPASAGASVLNPGMNLAKTRDRTPCRVKKFSVRRTQESGSTEIRHKRFNARLPCRRPSSYQIRSPAMQAITVRTIAPVRSIFPAPAKAPAANRIGTAGNGNPICSTNTIAKSTSSPYWDTNALTTFIPLSDFSLVPSLPPVLCPT